MIRMVDIVVYYAQYNVDSVWRGEYQVLLEVCDHFLIETLVLDSQCS